MGLGWPFFTDLKAKISHKVPIKLGNLLILVFVNKRLQAIDEGILLIVSSAISQASK